MDGSSKSQTDNQRKGAGKGMKPQHGRNMKRWYENFPPGMGPKKKGSESKR